MIPPVRGCGSAPDGCCSGGRVSPYGRLEVLGGHPGLDQHDSAAVVHGVHHAAEPPAAALRPLGQQARPPTRVARQAAHPAVPGTRGPLATDPGQRRPLGQRQAVPPTGAAALSQPPESPLPALGESRHLGVGRRGWVNLGEM
jgi:hypothetical protein